MNWEAFDKIARDIQSRADTAEQPEESIAALTRAVLLLASVLKESTGR